MKTDEKENNKRTEEDEKRVRKGSTGRDEELGKTPATSMEDINELQNDVSQTEVNPAVKKRSPLNKQEDKSDPDKPINPPGFNGL